MYTKFRIQYKMNGLLLNHLELNSFPAFIVPDHFIFIIIVMFFFSSAVEKVSCFFFISSWTLICWTKMNAFFCCCPGSLYYCCCFQFIKKLSSIACGILFGKFGLLKKNLNIRIVTLNLCYELKHEKKVNERHSKWKKKTGEKQLFLYFVSFSVIFCPNAVARCEFTDIFYELLLYTHSLSLSFSEILGNLLLYIFFLLLLLLLSFVCFVHIKTFFVMGYCQCVLCLRNVLLKSSFRWIYEYKIF